MPITHVNSAAKTHHERDTRLRSVQRVMKDSKLLTRVSRISESRIHGLLIPCSVHHSHGQRVFQHGRPVGEGAVPPGSCLKQLWCVAHQSKTLGWSTRGTGGPLRGFGSTLGTICSEQIQAGNGDFQQCTAQPNQVDFHGACHRHLLVPWHIPLPNFKVLLQTIAVLELFRKRSEEFL